jgi:hypothetical protein
LLAKCAGDTLFEHAVAVERVREMVVREAFMLRRNIGTSTLMQELEDDCRSCGLENWCSEDVGGEPAITGVSSQEEGSA